MEGGSTIGQLVGWALIAAVVIAYFAAVLREHWRDEEKRKRERGPDG